MSRQSQNLEGPDHCLPNDGLRDSTSSLRQLGKYIKEDEWLVLASDHGPLGVDAPPGFRIRWGFFFVVDELTVRFFLEETSSGVGGLSTEESIRPLRRREFVGRGGTGVVILDSAETYKSSVGSWKTSILDYGPLRLLLDGSRVGFRRRVFLELPGSRSGGFGYVAPGTRVTLGWILNLVSLSPSKGRSSKPSSSVPSPYNFGRFGRFKTFMEPVIGDGVGGLGC